MEATLERITQPEEEQNDIIHSLGFEQGKALCGAKIAPYIGPVIYADCDCVVCWDIWNSLNETQRIALCRFWGL